MPQHLVIIGTGGNALDILDIVDAANAATPRWQVFGFLDDAKAAGTPLYGSSVLGGLTHTAALAADIQFVVAIGSDRSYRRRGDIIRSLALGDERFATLVHPRAAVSARATVGPGTCVNAGAVVAGEVTIGRHVWLGTNCTLGHDAVVEDFAMIAPGSVLSGFVRVGESAYVGGGSCVRQRSHIGPRALIGLGAVVIGDVPEGQSVVGNPARVLVRKPKTTGTVTPPPKLEQTQE